MPEGKEPAHSSFFPSEETLRRWSRIQGLFPEAKEQSASLLLYIEPSAIISDEPLVDTTTQKMTAAFRQATEGERWRGYHRCACGVHSDNCDYILPSGHQTNSLAMHYLALHREEVPVEQIEIVDGFGYGLAEPSIDELKVPNTEK